MLVASQTRVLHLFCPVFSGFSRIHYQKHYRESLRRSLATQEFPRKTRLYEHWFMQISAKP